MKTIILFFFILCFNSFIFCQSLVADFNIHFNSNSSVISSEELKVIDQKINELTNLMVAYKFSISGYADATGNAKFNQRLSKKRALSVSKYIAKRGIAQNQMITQYFASDDSLASNLTEEGKALNRRTNVKIFTKKQIPKTIAGFQLKPQEYTFKCDEGGEIKTASGTKFKVPKDAFIDDNGNIVKGDVKIEVVEYRDPLDFVFADEPMSLEQNGKIAFYQSDGMFKIEAKQGTQKLSLAPGKAIESEMKLKRNQSESRFYQFDANSGQWNNGQSINQNTLTLGHDAQFSNSADCREAMVVFKLNSKYSSGEKISPDYDASLKKEKDELAITPIYKSRNSETRLYQKLNRKALSLKNKLEQKEHIYAFKNRETRARKVSFELELHKKSKNKSQNETKSLNGLRLQVKRKALKSRDRKLAFRRKTQLVNVRLVKTDSTLMLNYIARIQKKTKGNIDTLEYKDSLSNVKLITSGWVSKIMGGRNKKNSFQNYQKRFQKYTKLIADIEGKLSVVKGKRDSVNDRITAYNDTIESTEFVKKIEKFTSFGQSNFLTSAKEPQWLFDFDNNQNRMNTRIDSILKTNQYANCSFRNNTYMQEQERQDKLKKALSSSGLGVNLTSMGTYNADAIKQLKKPDLIVANYVGENGKKIDITVIYVFDKTLNGVMRFDGFMNRSPYKFEVSRENAKSLIAFDDKMNAYMIPSDRFRKLIQNKKVVFVLQPFKKATSKEELRNQMAV
tara:strand:- start:251 stop:2452 length:2202 start_codon:yes stop_codon:yes gene_type:complete